MKTPKRTPWQHTPQPCLKADGELRCTINEQHARWKRKNRVKQLKRSLERYKNGTNLPFYCHELHAYKLLQGLKKPGDKATVNNWNFYTHRLLDIQSHIMQAIAQAGREAGACWERVKQRKEHQ